MHVPAFILLLLNAVELAVLDFKSTHISEDILPLEMSMLIYMVLSSQTMTIAINNKYIIMPLMTRSF